MTPYQTYVASTPYDVLIAAGVPEDLEPVMRLAHYNRCRGDVPFSALNPGALKLHASLRARAAEAIKRQGAMRAAMVAYYRMRDLKRRMIDDASLLRRALDEVAVPTPSSVAAMRQLQETQAERVVRLLASPIPDWRRAPARDRPRLKIEAAEATKLHNERDRLQGRVLKKLARGEPTREARELLQRARVAKSWVQRALEDIEYLATHDLHVPCDRPTQPVALVYRRHRVQS